MTDDFINAGARTVVNIAAFFDELRARTLILVAAAGASERGYFTPGEDEETRHLLVSYWQARAALFDLVISWQQQAGQFGPERPRAFLVAYAGGLLLIDAARFLRELVAQRPIVRAKLNEPDPHFGIPVGTYDAVQRSLTDPRHAWHLYHARRYFHEHRAELDPLATDPLIAEVIQIIARLEHRLDVRAARYALARLGLRFRHARDTLRRDLLGRAMYHVQASASRMVAEVSSVPSHRPHLPAAIGERLRRLVRPGDVLITRKKHALTNYFLPGYWPHAVLYLGDAATLTQLGIHQHEHVAPRWARLLATDAAEPLRVCEAQKDGVRIRSFASPLANDAVSVLRPRLAESDIARALARGIFHEGKPYDFDFDFTRSDRLVCTEVVYRAYDGIGGMSFVLSRRAGRMTLAAEDLVDMALARRGFDPVAAFAPDHHPELVTGEGVGPLLQATRR